MFVINLPYSLIIQPVYGEASNWVSWMTYAFILAYLIVGFLIYYVCRVCYLKFKEKNIMKAHEDLMNILQPAPNDL